MPCARTADSISALDGPSPTKTSLESGIAAALNRWTSVTRSFSGRNRPTVPMTNASSGNPTAARNSGFHRGENLAVSTPFGMNSTLFLGSQYCSSAMRSRVRDGTAMVEIRRRTARLVQTRRALSPETSSGPKPSSTWTAGQTGARMLPMTASMAPQL
ncbi:MAG: hypothetical protein A2107_14950 [Verrucomicrobia bacterium GWF2_62_7]|nr:MAG: hypothetical protein A2107_14950 [Verrucomicrobia bacterium GWF2_62_7]